MAERDADSIEAAGYTLGDTLGEGRFSQVFRGIFVKTGREHAVKVMDRQAIEEDEEAAEALRIEVEVLRAART